MAWQFEIGGKVVRLRDLGIDEVEQAIAGTGVDWYAFLAQPFKSAKAVVAFVQYLATDLGVEVPMPLTYERLQELIRDVEDDTATTYEDGNPQMGDQATV